MDIPKHTQFFKRVLHVGCGPKDAGRSHPLFATGDWQEIRLDIDPAVKPDIVASITSMPQVPNNCMDAIWSSHNLEHLYAHEVPLALREFWRVLKLGGFALLAMPDMQLVAQWILEGKLEKPVARSPLGPLSPIDVCFGHRGSIARGNIFMTHKTGFTAQTLAHKLTACGFEKVKVERQQIELRAIAFKPVKPVRPANPALVAKPNPAAKT